MFGIFLLVEFIGFTSLSVIELSNVDRLAIVLGGLIGMLIVSPFVWLITQPLLTDVEFEVNYMTASISEMLSFYQSEVQPASDRKEDTWKKYQTFVDDAMDVQALEGNYQANTLREAWQNAKEKHTESVARLFSMLDELALKE